MYPILLQQPKRQVLLKSSFLFPTTSKKIKAHQDELSCRWSQMVKSRYEPRQSESIMCAINPHSSFLK